MTYTLRVSVSTSAQNTISGIDEPLEVKIDDYVAVFQMRRRHLIIRVLGFSTQDEAESFLPRVQAGLWNIALVKHVAFTTSFERAEISLAEDPVQAGINIAKSFAIEDDSPVHGLGNEGGFAVFKTAENIRFFGDIEMSATVSSPIDKIVPIFVSAAKESNLQVIKEPRFSTAISLYLSQFYESSIKARLLILMMILEVLAPDISKHQSAVKLLESVSSDLVDRINFCTDEDEKFALESLKREFDFRKETSIRRRVRELVMCGSGLSHCDRSELARSVVGAYDLRGQLVHTGKADESELNMAFDTVIQVVKDLLRGRLGLQS